MKPENYGILFAFLSPFFSSAATIFKTGAAKNLDPFTVIIFGGLVGAAILFLIGGLLRKKINIQKIKENKKDLFFAFLYRGLLGEIFFTLGLSQTEAIKAIFLTKIEPYFVLILAWLFLKEKVRTKHLILLGIHLIGAVILSTGGIIDAVSKAQIGDLFIIIAMGFFAASYSYGKRLSHNIGSIYGNAISMGTASFILLPFLFVFYSPEKVNNSLGWIYLIIYIILWNVIGLTLWYASLKNVKAWIVSALRYVGPILGAPIAYVVLGETLNINQVFGAIIVIATSFLIIKQHLKERETTAKTAEDKEQV